MVRFDGLSRLSYLIPHPHRTRQEVSHIQRKEILLMVSLCAVNIMPLLTAGAFSIYDRHTWKQYIDRKLIQGVIPAPDSFALIDGLARGSSQKAQSLQMNKLMTREEIGKRMDELARKDAEMHDPRVKEKLERLSWEHAR